MKPGRAIFIPTNSKQLLAAEVAAYALKRTASDPDSFAVHVITTDDFPVLAEHEGQMVLRNGAREAWRNDDLQSFTPLRFAIPALMGYAGRAVVIDPDVFAVRDIGPLLDRDLRGAAIGARALHQPGESPRFATSVMVLDCARLRHWDLARDFGQLFTGERDYRPWIHLELEAAGSIDALEPEWNDFDHLTPQTCLLHNTRRVTQPWKTGLPVDFVVHRKGPPRTRLRQLWRLLKGKADDRTPTVYRPHPDPAQEQLFFSLLAECIERNLISMTMIENAIAQRELRADALKLLDRARHDARGRVSSPAHA